tara:strand:- start:453 stop:926 length:474 start_codon:yes stop_codon:yes gene_type:complete
MRYKGDTLEVIQQYEFEKVGDVAESLDLKPRQLGVIRKDKPNLFHHAMAGLQLSRGATMVKVFETLSEQTNSPQSLALDLAFQTARADQLESRNAFQKARIIELEKKEIKLDALSIHCKRLVRTSVLVQFDESMVMSDTAIIDLIKETMGKDANYGD